MSGFRERDCIDRMQACLERIEEYVQGMSREDFIADPKTIDAVFARILALAENARRLLSVNASIKENYPEMDWDSLQGLRNRLAHDYFGALPERIWNALVRRLPVTRKVLDHLKADYPESN